MFFDCLRLSLRDAGRLNEFESAAAPWKLFFERHEKFMCSTSGDVEKFRLRFCENVFFRAWEEGVLLEQHLPADFDSSWNIYASC